MEVKSVEYNLVRPDGEALLLPGDRYIAAVIRSSATVHAAGKDMKARPNAVCIFPAGDGITITGTGCELIADFFEFSPDSPAELYGAQTLRILHGYDTFRLSSFIHEMKLEIMHQEKNFDEMLEHYGQMFFLCLFRLTDSGIHAYPHRLDGLRSDIINMPYRTWSTDEMVMRAGMSRRQFYNSYLNAFGNSPQQEIILSRIEYAKMLLDSTEQRITEVAVACGWNSVEHFSRIFKQKTGVSPMRYRKRVDRKGAVNFVRKTYTPRDDAE